jgi:hypothetical protein
MVRCDQMACRYREDCPHGEPHERTGSCEEMECFSVNGVVRCVEEDSDER